MSEMRNFLLKREDFLNFSTPQHIKFHNFGFLNCRSGIKSCFQASAWALATRDEQCWFVWDLLFSDFSSLYRYELPAPSSGQKNDITAWQECVNNSMAQLEHQAVRIENLELMSQYGTNAWKVYNEWVTAAVFLQKSTRDTDSVITNRWHVTSSSSFSNLAFMIEMAQKELQKFRWAITWALLLYEIITWPVFSC